MSSRHKIRTDAEWMELIHQCRKSGLSDADWCRNQDIPISTFYNAVVRLRKKACPIPKPSGSGSDMFLDLTSASPDVVPIQVEPETTPATAVFPYSESTASHLDNSHMIEICLGQICIRVPNGSDPALLSAILTSVRNSLC